MVTSYSPGLVFAITEQDLKNKVFKPERKTSCFDSVGGAGGDIQKKHIILWFKTQT